jgi:hypothetical protein
MVVPLSLCPCSFRQIDAAAAATWPPPLNHVRAMLLSKWSRSSTPRLASSLQSPGALRLSHLAGAPGPLAVAASLDGTTSSHQGACADGTIFSGSR